jgi:hypothetical protein
MQFDGYLYRVANSIDDVNLEPEMSHKDLRSEYSYVARNIRDAVSLTATVDEPRICFLNIILCRITLSRATC